VVRGRHQDRDRFRHRPLVMRLEVVHDHCGRVREIRPRILSLFPALGHAPPDPLHELPAASSHHHQTPTGRLELGRDDAPVRLSHPHSFAETEHARQPGDRLGGFFVPKMRIDGARPNQILVHDVLHTGPCAGERRAGFRAGARRRAVGRCPSDARRGPRCVPGVSRAPRRPDGSRAHRRRSASRPSSPDHRRRQHPGPSRRPTTRG
jgi:hypothetical protein